MRAPRSTATAAALAAVLALGATACEEDGGIEDDVEQEVEEDVENVDENISEETDGDADE
ncbi:MAG: hypothetical protein KY461_14200 [Actinobacteria bacterium]|nr:hypothetical protein [Actinomycetota bacterium]